LRRAAASKRAALVYEDADAPLRSANVSARSSATKRSGDLAAHLMGERLQHQDFDDAAVSGSVVRGAKKPRRQSQSLKNRPQRPAPEALVAAYPKAVTRLRLSSS